MDKLKLNSLQLYFDEKTNEELQLYFGKHETIIDGIIVKLENVPLLIDKNSVISYPDKTKYTIKYFVEQAKEKGEKGISLIPNSKKEIRYSFAEKFNFKYSHIDYEYIPGLIREWNDGFLTPVFFNIKVLNKYSQDPDYKLDIFSGTYGSIYKGNEWHISFGINKNRKVIMWLGDIDDLPEEEKYYLRSENIDSDHDIHSEFYNGQIEVQFAEPSIEGKAFQSKILLNKNILEKYKFDLYTFHGEISSILENLNLPIFWNEKHTFPFIESLNRIFVESLNSVGIKTYINSLDTTQDIKNLKGLKLFQKFIEIHSNEEVAQELMLPLFVLYDFRIVSSHLLSNEKKESMLKFISERLKIEYKDDNYELIYKKLIKKILETNQKIIVLLESL
ncbi:hypothetical protein ACN9JZ_03735 [Aliarcobacter butzleri]|uniref:hypothetical protein n=1 Tax=Aliarcobacter butzleri TaxID=28197 RepID=UPI003AF57131